MRWSLVTAEKEYCSQESFKTIKSVRISKSGNEFQTDGPA